MMEFWPENQGQSHLYSKFGTVPGRNYTHNYHDRHQASHYPLYYGEQQQDQARESTYWTVPGSRTGGAQHEYSNWNNAERNVPSSSHFPFILDRQSSHHQDLGEYQPHDTREWAAAHRGARDYERAFLRDGWRRWEPCNPARYNRDISAKRSDSSHRELEAWAARYSHSLPRRRHIEAELRGSSQGLLGSSRSGTDRHVTTAQHAQQSANISESGLWDRGTRKQALYQSLSKAPDTRKVLDMKENTDYQRRVFSQPPCYIAPPPYNSPHKCSPATLQCDPSWGQDIRRQSLWSQPTVKKEDAAAHKRTAEKGAFTKANESKANIKLEGLTHQREEVEGVQRGSTLSVQSTHTVNEHMLYQKHPQVNQSSEMTEETSSKVIEGRKFKLNKRMGGMTIFCLVSRMAGTTENPSLPLHASQTTIRTTETGEVSEGPTDRAQDNLTHKLADEVDFTVPTLTEESNTSDVRNPTGEIKEITTLTGNQKPGDPLPNTAEPNTVFRDKVVPNNDCIIVKESVQPVSAKYPLWREPSFTSRAESSSTSCVKDISDEEAQQGCANVSSHPIDIEVRRLDIKENSESKGLLVIDTTCAVVKMELIQSPRKEHVHYFGSTTHTKDNASNVEPLQSLDLNNQQNLDVTDIENTQSPASPTNDSPETDLDSTLLENEERKILLPCKLTPQVYERAERILGISLEDCINEHQPEDELSDTDPGIGQQDEFSLIKNDIDDASKQQGDTMEEAHTKSCLELIQTEDAENRTDEDLERDREIIKEAEDFPEYQEPVSYESDNNKTDCYHEELESLTETDMTQDCLLATVEKDKCDQCEEVNWPIDEDQSSQACDLFNPLLHSPFNVEFSSCVSDSNAERSPDPEITPVTTPHPDTLSFLQPPLQQSQYLSPVLARDSSPNSPDHTDQCPCLPSHLDLLRQVTKPEPDMEDCDEEGESEMNSDYITVNETEEVVSPEQCDHANLDNAANVTNGQKAKQGEEIPVNVLEQILEPPEKTTIDAVVLEHCDSVQVEGDTSADEMNMTEHQPPKQDSGEHSSLSVKSEEQKEEEEQEEEQQEEEEQQHESDFQSEVKICPQQFAYGQEKDSFCATESCMIEDQSKNEAEAEPLVAFPSSASDDKMPQSDEDSADLHSPLHKSQESDTELGSPVDMGSLHHSPLNPSAAAGSQTLPPHLDLDSFEETVQVSSSSPDSPQILPPSSTLPPQDDGSPPSAALKDELQYPKSLWDVVNRIRKHTAPDSENEEEEMSEPWDPENAGDDLGGPGVVVNLERIVFDNEEQQEVSTDYVDVGQITQCGKSSNEHADEDTLSCSSTSSQGSGGTVIEADEDEDEGSILAAISESKSEDNEGFTTTGEQCCCSEARAEGNTEGQDQADTVETEKQTTPPVEKN